MLSKLWKHRAKVLITVVIVLCFGLIRNFERQFFYDPFLDYFEADFNNLPFPQVNVFKLFCGLLLRYFLNTIFSLLLIYNLFPEKENLKFSTILYVVFLVMLLGMFFFILNCFPNANWLLFYVRRFIIQPIFVLLFIPAFYYQQQNLKK